MFLYILHAWTLCIMLFGIILFFQELCNKTQLYLNLSLFSSQKRVSTHFCCWLAEKLTWVKVAEYHCLQFNFSAEERYGRIGLNRIQIEYSPVNYHALVKLDKSNVRSDACNVDALHTLYTHGSSEFNN